MIYSPEIDAYLLKINTDIAALGRAFYAELRQGVLKINDRENLELLAMGRDILNSHKPLYAKPTFFKKISVNSNEGTFDGISDIDTVLKISTDGTVGNTTGEIPLNTLKTSYLDSNPVTADFLVRILPVRNGVAYLGNGDGVLKINFISGATEDLDASDNEITLDWSLYSSDVELTLRFKDIQNSPLFIFEDSDYTNNHVKITSKSIVIDDFSYQSITSRFIPVNFIGFLEYEPLGGNGPGIEVYIDNREEGLIPTQSTQTAEAIVSIDSAADGVSDGVLRVETRFKGSVTITFSSTDIHNTDGDAGPLVINTSTYSTPSEQAAQLGAMDAPTGQDINFTWLGGTQVRIYTTIPKDEFIEVSYDSLASDDGLEVSLISNQIGNSTLADTLYTTEELTKAQLAETLFRQFDINSTDFGPLTKDDFQVFLVGTDVYIYSYSPLFSSSSTTEVTINGTTASEITVSDVDIDDFILLLNNDNDVQSVLLKIVDVCNEFKDRLDYTKTPANPFAQQSSSGAVVTGLLEILKKKSHTQGTDEYLAKGTDYQVSALELYTHLTNTEIHLTPTEIAAFLSIGDLNDVDLDNKANGYILSWNTSTDKFEMVALPDYTGANQLTELDDVVTAGVGDGEFLYYDGVSGLYKFKSLQELLNLNDLLDVDTTGVLDNYIIKYDIATTTWKVALLPNIPTILGDLADVYTLGVLDGQVLTWNQAFNRWEPTTIDTAGNLADLGDVDVTGVGTDSFLKYDTNTSTWKVFSVENPTLVTPTIYGNKAGGALWEVFENDEVTSLALLSGSLNNQSITVDVGAKVLASTYFKYPLIGAGQKGPDSISGNFGTTDPGPNTNSATFTHSNLEGSIITANSPTTKSYSVTLSAAKQGLQVSGSNVVVATGNDTKSDTISVVFKHRIYLGVSTNTSLLEPQIKALSVSRFGDNTENFTGITAGVGEYLYFIYDSQYSDLTNIILDGAAPILGAFTKLANVPITNPAGVARILKVYRSNATQAFTNNSLNFS